MREICWEIKTCANWIKKYSKILVKKIKRKRSDKLKSPNGCSLWWNRMMGREITLWSGFCSRRKFNGGKNHMEIKMLNGEKLLGSLGYQTIANMEEHSNYFVERLIKKQCSGKWNMKRAKNEFKYFVISILVVVFVISPAFCYCL